MKGSEKPKKMGKKPAQKSLKQRRTREARRGEADAIAREPDGRGQAGAARTASSRSPSLAVARQIEVSAAP